MSTTYVLVRRELQENALSNLRSRTTELQPLVATLAADSAGGAAGLRPRLQRLRADLRLGLRITDLSAVLVAPDGTVNALAGDTVFSLPSGVHRGRPRHADAARGPGRQRAPRQHRVSSRSPPGRSGASSSW